jgi:hypothetical protein
VRKTRKVQDGETILATAKGGTPDVFTGASRLFRDGTLSGVEAGKTRLRAWLATYATPAPGKGQFYLPPGMVPAFDAEVAACRKIADEASRALSAQWDEILAKMKADRGTEFDPNLYPSKESVEGGILRIDASLAPATVPPAFAKEIARGQEALAKRLQDEFDKEAASIEATVRAEVLRKVNSRVENAMHKILAAMGGERVRMHPSTHESIRELARIVKATYEGEASPPPMSADDLSEIADLVEAAPLSDPLSDCPAIRKLATKVESSCPAREASDAARRILAETEPKPAMKAAPVAAPAPMPAPVADDSAEPLSIEGLPPALRKLLEGAVRTANAARPAAQPKVAPVPATATPNAAPDEDGTVEEDLI